MRGRSRRPSMVESDTRDRRKRQCFCSLELMILGYLAVFLGSITSSMRHVFGTGVAIPAVGETTTASAAIELVWHVAVVVGVVVLLRFYILGQWPWKRQRHRPSADDVAAAVGGSGLVLLLVVVGSMAVADPLHAAGLLNYQVGGIPGPPPAVWMQSVNAGVTEEILALAVPVTVLRYFRVPLRWAIVVLVCLRVAYHLYYGWIGGLCCKNREA